MAAFRSVLLPTYAYKLGKINCFNRWIAAYWLLDQAKTDWKRLSNSKKEAVTAV